MANEKANRAETLVINFLAKPMAKMTLTELLEYEKYITKETNDDNADDMLAILNELDIYKLNLSQKHL